MEPADVLKLLLVLLVGFRGGHELLHDLTGFLLELKNVAILALTPRALGEGVLFPTLRNRSVWGLSPGPGARTGFLGGVMWNWGWSVMKADQNCL